MDEQRARAILTEVARRAERPPEERILRSLFGHQRKLVEDHATDIAGVCTRRAGKSYTAAALLYRYGFKYPNSNPLYIALTRDSAKKILWPVLTDLNEKHKLGSEMVESSLSVKLPNKSIISLVGADMKNFVERLRGPKYPVAIIDEAQAFRSHLQYLIDDILKPALLDYNGPLVLLGTPGPIPSGVFYDATEKDIGYSAHKWSLYDNPHLPNAREYVAGLKRKRGWTDDNPTYRREWLGEWVVDIDALVYKFKRESNCFDALPEGHDWMRVLSIDYGWNDATAFAIASYSHSLREVFIEHAEGHSEMVPSDIANRINQLRERWNPVCIVADTGGLGKSITEEFIRRYSIPIRPAMKTEKLTAIALMNGDFIDRKLWVHRSLIDLQDQYLTLTKGEDHMEDPSLPNDLADSCLYAARQCKHYLGEIAQPKPKPGTVAHAELEAKRILEQDIEAFQNEKAEPWWINA